MSQNLPPFRNRKAWWRAFAIALVIEVPLFLLTVTMCWGRCDRGLQSMAVIVWLFVLQLPGSFLAVLGDGAIVLSTRAISRNSNALLYFSDFRYYPLVLVLQVVSLTLFSVFRNRERT